MLGSMLHYNHCTKAAMASPTSAILYGTVNVRLQKGRVSYSGTKPYITEQTSAMSELFETKGKVLKTG